MLSFTGRDNTTEKIEEAIDYVNDRIVLDDSCMPTVRFFTTSCLHSGYFELYQLIFSALDCCSYLILSQRICQIEMKHKFLQNLSLNAFLLCL